MAENRSSWCAIFIGSLLVFTAVHLYGTGQYTTVSSRIFIYMCAPSSLYRYLYKQQHINTNITYLIICGHAICAKLAQL